MSNEAVTVFFSYSHKDRALRDELANHLKPLTQSGMIADWHDGEILPGDNWDREIQEKLNSAQIILLLVSSDFISSPYCETVEMKKAMARHDMGEARVIPIILRNCLWRMMSFGKLQALPTNGVPVTNQGTWRTRDDAFFDITEGILQVVERFALKLQEYKSEVMGSERSIDYTKLRDLLKAGEWAAADRETYEVVMRAMDKLPYTAHRFAQPYAAHRFTQYEILNFPRQDLCIIDRLWVKYSNERFGFSVQRKIYLECGAMLDGQYPGDIVWARFWDRTGWRVFGVAIESAMLNFSPFACKGHLPAWPYWYCGGNMVHILSHRSLIVLPEFPF